MIGEFDTVQQCADVCANTRGCYFFDFSTNPKGGRCYWEKTQGDDDTICPEGYRSNQYDFYELTGTYDSIQYRPMIMSFTAFYHLIVFIGKSPNGWTLVSTIGECKSGDEYLKGGLDSIDECADLCKNKYGCNFFDFGYGSKKGRCYMEYTTSAACTEGFETDKYYFYAVNSKYNGLHLWKSEDKVLKSGKCW